MTDAEKYDKAFREGKIPPHARGGSAFKNSFANSAQPKKMNSNPGPKKEGHDHPKAKMNSMAKKMKVPKHYRGNTNSEGGVPFGKNPYK